MELKEHEIEVTKKVIELIETYGFTAIEATAILAEAREAHVAKLIEAQYTMTVDRWEARND